MMTTSGFMSNLTRDDDRPRDSEDRQRETGQAGLMGPRCGQPGLRFPSQGPEAVSPMLTPSPDPRAAPGR